MYSNGLVMFCEFKIKLIKFFHSVLHSLKEKNYTV